MRKTTTSFRKRIVKSYDLPSIELAKQIIEQDLIDHWPLSILASKAGVNELKLKVGFKELYKISPYQYLIKLRLEKARQLLENTDLNIKEIATRIGFDGYRGFSKAFRKNFGVPPAEFRSLEEACHDLSMPALIAI
jgi:transcriptional regulator GlxA family with amidase domain